MSEKVFRSRLSEAEIEENFRNTDFFSGIMEGLEEALAYDKGGNDCSEAELAGGQHFRNKETVEAVAKSLCIRVRRVAENRGSLGKRQVQSDPNRKEADFFDRL